VFSGWLEGGIGDKGILGVVSVLKMKFPESNSRAKFYFIFCDLSNYYKTLSSSSLKMYSITYQR